jgi:asparagine synthetase B (glutamine-hydrolysing)
MSEQRASDQTYLRHLIRDAIRRSSVHGLTGFVISGGLDSSTVRCLSETEGPTFTGYYEGEAYDEREYANLVKSADHHEILITPQDFIENFDAMIPHLKPPFQGPGTFGQYMVGKYIAWDSDLKVVLSGEGADELFGGYARLMYVGGHELPDGYENYQLPDDYPQGDLEAALQYDLDRLPGLLAVDDQCMAAHGLEARAPFTDEAIVEFALALPPEERVGKHYLREAVRGFVPDRIIDRTDKKGFPSPLVTWAQGPCRDFIHDRLGYIPNRWEPWARGWWVELCEKAYEQHLLAQAA